MVSQLEWMKKQCDDLAALIRAEGGSRETLAEISSFNKKLQSMEDELFQPTIAEGDSKSFRFPQKLYCKLSVLAGDVAGMVDFAPNNQQREVLSVLKERLAVQNARYAELLKSDLKAFNDFLKEKGLSVVNIPEIR